MSKRRFSQGLFRKEQAQPALKQQSFQSQLQALLKQKKYRQALDEIKKIRKAQSNIEFTPTEAEIWSLRGQQEFEKSDYKQAETSFRRALELELPEAYYWIARCLLQLNRLDAALEFIQTAFEQNTLPKDYAICYLKLLLLNGETAKVETLIRKQSKRFSAAQLHWVRGVLALKSEEPEAALNAFQKIKRPLTAADLPDAWIVYAQQALTHWEAAARVLGLKTTSMWGFSLTEPRYMKHEILQRLAIVQRAQTGEPPLTASDLQRNDRTTQEAVTAITIVQLAEGGDYHNAAHVLLNHTRKSSHFPELADLRAPLLIQAGQQALQQGEPECTEAFWQPLLAEQPFDPQLAINLRIALDLNGSYQAEQRLITRLIKWVEQDAKQKPQEWGGSRLPRTLAHLHCYLADTWAVLGRARAARGEVQQAERIDPTSPEVIGRKGLIELLEERYQPAIQLLTQALEQGCRSREVYEALLTCWEKLGNAQAKLDTRRRFGQKFGDLNPEADIEFAPWLMALYTRDYAFFSRILDTAEQPDLPMQALQVWLQATQSSANSSGKVSLNQEQAKQQWDALLKQATGESEILVLEAIVLSLHLYAKREKGIAALSNQYVARLAKLAETSPAARTAHLLVLAVKETSGQKLDAPLRSYLETMPQPSNALAQLQFQVRKFGWIRSLIPFLENALRQEPQNPLLLLARATTYPLSMAQYQELKQQAFEIARRVQDAKALQALREEESFVELMQTQAMMPDPDELDSFDASDMDMFLENLIRQTMGQKVPKAELERMLPILKQQMMNEFADLTDGDDDDDDDDFFVDFGRPKKRKRSFRDL